VTSRRAEPLSDIAKLPKGPHGRALCRRCHREVPPNRRAWCSEACVEAYRDETDWNRAVYRVKKRDRGVCAKCGLDCIALEAKLWGLPHLARRAELVRIGFKRWPNRLWEIDHAIPLCEGGARCDLTNLRTLCWKCHAGETRKLAKRRAAARRAGS
jgi:5-methylcytosine-specific restriction protein A